MPYSWWIPVVVVLYAVCGVLSVQNAQHRGLWTLWVMLAGWVPLWALVSRYSKNLLFDGALYDCLMLLSYLVAVTVCGGGDGFRVNI